MSNVQLAFKLKDVGRNLYLYTNPEVLDFTKPKFQGELIISTQQNIEIRLPLTNLLDLFGLLNACIFEDVDISVLCWNFKNLASYFKFFTNSQIIPECKLLDLKIAESYLNIHKPTPKIFSEALGRARTLLSDPSWVQVRQIYQSVYMPLISDVIPCLETQGIFDKRRRQLLHAYYEFDGKNGRLKCSGAYSKGFVPHSMGPQERQDFCPREANDLFMYFDYKNMEVSMLAWLSKDERLLELLEQPEDFYKLVFRLVSGTVCDNEKKREMAKGFFLPVVFGMGVGLLAKDLNISEKTAGTIIDRIYNVFRKSLTWVEDYQNSNLNCDIFGRKREFADRYLIRNFIVQSPAALVCLEKLILLHRSLKGYAKIACHIHDGYVVYAPKISQRTVAGLAQAALDSASVLCPGLKLKSICKVGVSLQEMEGLNEEDEHM